LNLPRYATLPFLNAVYKKYHRPEFIPTDVILFPHRFQNERDIEISALLSALLAFGTVKSISTNLKSLFRRMGRKPYEYIRNAHWKREEGFFSSFRHRFVRGEDLLCLLQSLQKIYERHPSLEALFLQGYSSPTSWDDALMSPTASGIAFFIREIRQHCPQTPSLKPGLRFLLASPEPGKEGYQGSACKRLNLFLRWMVRKDDIDFGLWRRVSPADLIMPLDTHIVFVSRRWGFLHRKSIDWKSAEEITQAFRRFSPQDPLKYDFSLTRFLMLER